MMLRQIFILIISALVLFFSYRYYSTDFCPSCCSLTAATTEVPLAATSPLLFSWSEHDAITSDGFDELRTAILAERSDGDAIEITGHYFANEKNTTEYENLGLARAVSVSELLLEEDPDLKIITKAKLVDMEEGAETTAFESMSYTWISDEESSQERIEVNESGDAKILFPFNSSDKMESANVERYLDDIAEKLKSDPNLKVYIVGHTDSLGEPGPNRRLSERRAKKIRDILKSKGVSNRQIVPSGRGEADPVAPNTNEANRQLNRRVEINIK